ncbi:hypothetical protein AVEN_242503-1 [Araneus ventricosus]|uniref:Uncharacterized protein n=1 Tax=Araneus ventricosus TaxID=182803 RepID=A0A4Y2PFY5_ARAVE|nr:hypothetical protein AVEN_242503-1 [Araneus ventricosus]
MMADFICTRVSYTTISRVIWVYKELTNSRREETITLRHCRVVFGASPSPFSLEATIAHHMQNSSSFSKLLLCRQLTLRGTVTSEKIVEESHKRFISILGLSSDTEIDERFYNSVVEIPEEEITKRTVLSAAHRLLDPIDVTCPVPLIHRLLLQNIRKRKTNWDDVLPPDISNKFLTWVKELHLLKDCKIPRRLVSGPFKECRISLHRFSDASEVSYAARIFLRSEFNKKISVKLTASKSRVAKK